MKGIKKRLERLRSLADKQKEVDAEECVKLWLEFVERLIKDEIEPPSYFSPPFGNVDFETFERARKELEGYDR